MSSDSSESDSSSSSSSNNSDGSETKQACAVSNMATNLEMEKSQNIDMFEGNHHRGGGCELAEANLAATQSADSTLPLGPSTYDNLFLWADHFAEELLNNCANASSHRNQFSKIATKTIVHHDAYAGLGTSSIAAKHQLLALTRKFQSIQTGSSNNLAAFSHLVLDYLDLDYGFIVFFSI